MQYTKDNILNLRFRRGGTAEYIITDICGQHSIRMTHVQGGKSYGMSLENALEYFNTGKWQVVQQAVPVIEENNYQIY